MLGLGCDRIHPLHIQKQPISALLCNIPSKCPSCPPLHTSKTRGLSLFWDSTGYHHSINPPPRAHNPFPSPLSKCPIHASPLLQRLTSPAPEEGERLASFHPSGVDTKGSACSQSSHNREGCARLTLGAESPRAPRCSKPVPRFLGRVPRVTSLASSQHCGWVSLAPSITLPSKVPGQSSPGKAILDSKTGILLFFFFSPLALHPQAQWFSSPQVTADGQ